MSTSKEVLNTWYQRVSVSKRAHYRSAEHFARKSYWLGIPVIGLTTFVGTSVFATLQKQPELWLQISIGLASVLSAVLASLQTFLGYSARAEKHRIAGAKYGALGRELEAVLASSDDPSAEVIEKIRERLDALAMESPNSAQPINRLVSTTKVEDTRSVNKPNT